AASAKRIQNHIAGIARSADDTLEQRQRLLRLITQALASSRTEAYVSPNILKRRPLSFLQIFLKAVLPRRPIALQKYATSCIQAFEFLDRESPLSVCSRMCSSPLNGSRLGEMWSGQVFRTESAALIFILIARELLL